MRYKAGFPFWLKVAVGVILFFLAIGAIILAASQINYTSTYEVAAITAKPVREVRHYGKKQGEVIPTDENNADEDSNEMADAVAISDSGNTDNDKVTDDSEMVGNSEDESAEKIFGMFAGQYMYTPGAGFHSAQVVLYSDGTFIGENHDTEMGASGAGYVSTIWYSKFSGKFINPKMIDAYTYSFELGEIQYENTPGSEEIKPLNGSDYNILYKYGDAHELLGSANTVYAFLADTPVSYLPEYAFIPELSNDRSKLAHNGLYSFDGYWWNWRGGIEQ